MIDLDIGGWLVAAIGAVVAYGAIKSRNAAVDKRKDAERRTQAMANTKKESERVETLDDDSLVSEFDRVRKSRRRR